MKLKNIFALYSWPGVTSSTHLTTPLFSIVSDDCDFAEVPDDGYFLIKIK